MGYTHSCERKPHIELAVWKNIITDFGKLVPVMANHGVALAGGSGKGKPIVNRCRICFNGPRRCGHPRNPRVVVPWPAAGATGVDTSEASISGTWLTLFKPFPSLNARCCNGSCVYETFELPRIFPVRDYPAFLQGNDGMWCGYCKTAFRPYDIAVTACLVVAKHYLGDDIRVTTAGEDAHWFDARMLCQSELGYGMEYSISTDHVLSLDPAGVLGEV
jgi:hypothetical protein